MRSQDEKIRQMLGAFGRALAEAINGSTEISGAARQIQREGYSLHLVLGCLQETAGDGVAAPSPERTPAQRALPAKTPAFRLNGEDVSFLRSIGIDPTRPVRRRRKPGSTS